MAAQKRKGRIRKLGEELDTLQSGRGPGGVNESAKYEALRVGVAEWARRYFGVVHGQGGLG